MITNLSLHIWHIPRSDFQESRGVCTLLLIPRDVLISVREVPFFLPEASTITEGKRTASLSSFYQLAMLYALHHRLTPQIILFVLVPSTSFWCISFLLEQLLLFITSVLWNCATYHASLLFEISFKSLQRTESTNMFTWAELLHCVCKHCDVFFHPLILYFSLVLAICDSRDRVVSRAVYLLLLNQNPIQLKECFNQINLFRR